MQEQLEGHRAATIAYSKFSRNIAVELSLPREDRNSNGTEFINNSRTELDRLIEQSPNIPMDIIRRFAKKFNNIEFNKPEILHIMPVDIYIDDEKEKLEQELVALKKAEEMRRELINTEQLRRRSFMEELTEKSTMDKEKEQKKLEDYKKKRKENVNIKSVEGGLNKLLQKLTNADENDDIITPESSDNEVNDNTNIILDISDVSANNQE